MGTAEMFLSMSWARLSADHIVVEIISWRDTISRMAADLVLCQGQMARLLTDKRRPSPSCA
jgi:hypothetical protein